MNNLPTLQLITYEKETLKAIMDQLKEVGLNKYCDIKGTLINSVRPEQQADLFLITNESIYNMVKNNLNKKTPVIIAKRLINFSNIKELLSIPYGSNVYLVSNMKEATEDTIHTLLELGIKHNYIPYYGQEEVDESIEIAITPGEIEYVPRTVKRIIDIGHRLLDITTLIEVHDHFNIPTYKSNNKLTARYIQSMISIINELNKQVLQTRGYHKSLINVVDHFEDGIIVYDFDKNILTLNKIACEILQKENHYFETLDDLPTPFLEAFMKMSLNRENFIDIGHETYYIRKKRIITEDKVFATVIFFSEIENIKRIETKYRRQTNQRSFVTKYTFEDIKTTSQQMINIVKKAKRLAKSDSTIFIHGQTGTGKEVFAQAIHSESPRYNNPFVAVNLAAIPDTLAESELFGYEKGAFTGARSDGSIGLFEKAHNGTIFLDEIGDASYTVQNLLLRVLQEREIQRIGGGHPIPINIRVIAATNKNLLSLVQQKKFREDLYYRLHVLPIHLPSLQERKSDIMLLADVFCKDFEEKLKRPPIIFSEEVVNFLKNYHWPGNVRELRNTIEYLAHVSGEVVQLGELPFKTVAENIKSNKVTNNAKNIIQSLSDKGFLRECFYILKIIQSVKDKGIGRYKLNSRLADTGIFLTDQMLRYRMEILSEKNLIIVRQGRGGSVISEKGKTILRIIKEKYI